MEGLFLWPRRNDLSILSLSFLWPSPSTLPLAETLEFFLPSRRARCCPPSPGPLTHSACVCGACLALKRLLQRFIIGLDNMMGRIVKDIGPEKRVGFLEMIGLFNVSLLPRSLIVLNRE